MKIYLAGPMRGLPKFNFPAFDFAAHKLRNEGHFVFSPAERDRAIYGEKLEDNATGDEKQAEASVGFSIREALAADTDWIAKQADAIALLPGWEKSSGVAAELALAIAIGLEIQYLGQEYIR